MSGDAVGLRKTIVQLRLLTLAIVTGTLLFAAVSLAAYSDPPPYLIPRDTLIIICVMTLLTAYIVSRYVFRAMTGTALKDIPLQKKIAKANSAYIASLFPLEIASVGGVALYLIGGDPIVFFLPLTTLLMMLVFLPSLSRFAEALELLPHERNELER